MDISYKDKQMGSRRVDFLVEDKVLVELKAIINLEDVHLAQAINYLEAYNLEIGLLRNFGSKSLQKQRITKFCPSKLTLTVHFAPESTVHFDRNLHPSVIFLMKVGEQIFEKWYS